MATRGRALTEGIVGDLYRVYVETGGNVSETARRCAVSPTTVERYRDLHQWGKELVERGDKMLALSEETLEKLLHLLRDRLDKQPATFENKDLAGLLRALKDIHQALKHTGAPSKLTLVAIMQNQQQREALAESTARILGEADETEEDEAEACQESGQSPAGSRK